MGTVSKQIADRVIAGEFPEDEPVLRIVKYRNAWGGESYGIETKHNLGAYHETAYVQNPEVYWQAPQMPDVLAAKLKITAAIEKVDDILYRMGIK